MKLDVKRSFVLADWMKSARSRKNVREFDALLVAEKLRVQALSETELDQIIVKDEGRLKRFNKYQWKLDEHFDLTTCRVYDRMGNRPWAIGTVHEVAGIFHRMEPTGSRVWRMMSFVEFFSSSLPLIVVENNGSLQIDDGSHRAVAMYLAGMTQTSAYVGTRPSSL